MRRLRFYRWLAIIPVFFLMNLFARPAVQAQEGAPLSLPANTRLSHLTTDDGLAHNVVTAVLQDQYGFMWLGTEDGLNLYDGYRFTLFKRGTEAGSLSDNAVTDLVEDDRGRIWVATKSGGINIFDRYSEMFTPFDPKGDGRLTTATVSSLVKGKDGHIWMSIGVEGVLAKFESETELFSEYPLPLGIRRVENIVVDEEGIVWAASNNGLIRLDPETGISHSYQPLPAARRPPPPPNDPNAGENDNEPAPPPPPPNLQGPVQDVFIDHNGSVWIVASGHLHKFDRQTEEFRSFMVEGAADGVIPNSLFADSQGQLWVGSEAGLLLFDLQTEQFINHFMKDAIRPDSLSSDHIQLIYEDAGHVVWIGTDNGLNLLNRQQAQFSRYQFHPLNENSLAAPSVGAIFVDAEGIVWTETELHLNRLDRATGEISHYADEVEPFARGAPPVAQRLLGIYDDGVGALWLARWEGVDRFDKAMGTFERFQPENHLADNPTKDGFGAMAAGEEDVWVATAQRLYKFDPKTTEFEEVLLLAEFPNQARLIEQLYVTADTVWITFREGGLGRFIIETNQFIEYLPNSADLTALPRGDVHAIYQLEDVVWVGSNDGLSRLDLDDGTFSRFGKESGLPNTAVRAILADESGQLWLSTFKGLLRFDPQQGEAVRNYEVADGLPSNDFNAGVAFQSRHGEMFFGSREGLVVFDPSRIQDNSYQPPVVLTKMVIINEHEEVSYQDFSSEPIYLTDEIELGPEDELFFIDFAVLSYASSEKNQYEYILDDHDEGWWTKEENGQYAVDYSRVEADEYEFRVRGTNNDGVWSEHEVNLKITVVPHWYDTELARGLGILGLIFAVGGVFVWQAIAEQRKTTLLEAQVAERTQKLSEQTAQLEIARDKAEAANRSKSTFLSNMSHELRSPLNAILGFAQVMLRSPNLSGDQTKNLNIINRSGEHLLTLINQVLDFSKIEAGRTVLHETDFDLYRLIEDVENMFRLKAEEQNLQLLFELTPDVPHFVRSDEVKLRQVLINLLNNALKFTAEGGVSVRVGRGNEEQSNGGSSNDGSSNDVNIEHCQLVFEIEDTGAGIAEAETPNLFEAFAQTEAGRQSQEGTGLGLPISRRFVQLMGGEMTAHSEVGTGSVFRFEIKAEVAETAVFSVAASSRRVIALASNQPRYRVLIVDDMVTNRQVVVSLLAPLGFELREAANGQEAIEVWQEFSPDLIWMDMRMPIMNGYEATTHIKGTEQGQETIIVALTASSFEEERHVILEAGCDDYLRKPFRENEMFEMLHQHLGVEFVYEEEGAVDGRYQTETALKHDDLDLISATLLMSLAQAIESIDLAGIDETLAQIGEENSEVALKLRHLVDQFEYDTILETIEKK